MLKIYVKHYLTAEGIHYFEQHWFPKVYSVMSLQDGFISVNYTKSPIELDLIDIILEFRDKPSLNAWCAVPIHDELIQDLDKYRSRSYWKAASADTDTLGMQALEWEIIEPDSF